MKKIMLINGHPAEDSLNGQNAKVIKEALEKNGHEVKYFRAYDYPLCGHIMKEGCKESFSEPADALLWSDIIVVITPMWHFNITGGLKNFFDGTIQSKKHYMYKKIPLLKTGRPIGFLKDKKVITVFTTGGPRWVLTLAKFVTPDNLIGSQIKSVFRLCGVPLWNFKTYGFYNVSKWLPQEKYDKWFKKLQKIFSHIK